jgi:hypothetical protein
MSLTAENWGRQVTHKTLVVTFFVALAAICCYQDSHAEDVSNGLLACAKLGDPLERVTCYDRLTARVRAQMSPASATSPSSRGAEPPVAPATPGGSASPTDMFGARPLAVPAATVERKELDSITAHVTALREKNGGVQLDLDNGQQWQQVGHADLFLKVGERVVISRGAFSSFWLMSEGNRTDHFKRIL